MRLVIVASIVILLAACAGTSPAPVSQSDGAAVKKTSPNVYVIYASGGKADIDLQRDEDVRTRLYYKYRQNLPFVQIREVRVTDLTTGKELDTEALKASGELSVAGDKIYVQPGEGGINWRISVNAPAVES